MERHHPQGVIVDSTEDGGGVHQAHMTARGIQQERAKLVAGDQIQCGTSKPGFIHPRPPGQYQQHGKSNKDQSNDDNSPIHRHVAPSGH